MVNHMRHTRAQSGSRRSHHALKSKFVTLCKNCGQPKHRHAMCANCGQYKGRIVVDIVKIIDKKQAKKNKQEGR